MQRGVKPPRAASRPAVRRRRSPAAFRRRCKGGRRTRSRRQPGRRRSSAGSLVVPVLNPMISSCDRCPPTLAAAFLPGIECWGLHIYRERRNYTSIAAKTQRTAAAASTLCRQGAVIRDAWEAVALANSSATDALQSGHRFQDCAATSPPSIPRQYPTASTITSSGRLRASAASVFACSVASGTWMNPHGAPLPSLSISCRAT